MELRIRVIDHPLAKHCLAQLRDRRTPPAAFRGLTRQLSTLLAIMECGQACNPTRGAPTTVV
ncbi:MAG: uracil phosphoribosyltransferase, partial [Acidobacteriota bacterium]